MKQDTTVVGSVQQVTWETLESYVRAKVQQFVQELLEAEVRQLLIGQVPAACGGRCGTGVSQRVR